MQYALGIVHGLYTIIKGLAYIITLYTVSSLDSTHELLSMRIHTGLTRVSSIRFLLFEIKRVLVFNSIIIYFTDLFILYIFIQNAFANKKVFKKKG